MGQQRSFSSKFPPRFVVVFPAMAEVPVPPRVWAFIDLEPRKVLGDLQGAEQGLFGELTREPGAFGEAAAHAAVWADHRAGFRLRRGILLRRLYGWCEGGGRQGMRQTRGQNLGRGESL